MTIPESSDALYKETAKFYDLDWYEELSKADIPFYVNYAKKLNGNILDVACGTGRVSIPLVLQGYNVLAIDISKTMLDQLQTKVSQLPSGAGSRIRTAKYDMADFDLAETFSLIIVPGRSFQALLNDRDQKSALKCVHSHLSDTGRFIVTVAQTKSLKCDSHFYDERLRWERIDPQTGDRVSKFVRGIQIDRDKQFVSFQGIYRIIHLDGKRKEIRQPITLKYY